MNKYILGGVGLLIIVATFVLVKTDKPFPTETAPIVSENAQTPARAEGQMTEQIVTYTSEGFFPAELTVKSGTTVTFVNQSDAPLWVASGPHPTHTLYPEFDAKTSVSKGGSYSFTFTKTGAHPYHNHVLLGKFGKIIVE